jgi:crossover junction endodeoxyribonuclease RusA
VLAKLGLPAKRKARLDREAKVCSPNSFDLRSIDNGGWMVWLPWPPSNNVYWRRYRNVTTIGKDGKAYRAAVQSFLADRHGVRFGDKRLSVSMRLSAPSHRRYDLDNMAKCILDSLTHAGVFIDDSQIDILTMERGLVMPGIGQAIVTIREVGR